MTTNEIELHVVGELGVPDVTLELDPYLMTPQEIVQHLGREGEILPSPGSKTFDFRVAHNGRTLDPGTTLAKQGVTDHATLTLISNHVQGSRV